MNRAWEVPFRYIVLAALLICIAGLLWYIREIFKPLLTAALIAYFLSPAVNFLASHSQMRRKTAAIVVYASTLAGLIIFSITAVPAMIDEVQSILVDFQAALIDVEAFLSKPFQLMNLELDLRLLVPALRGLFSEGGAIVPQPAEALRFLQLTSRGFLWTLVVLVTVYYLMTEWDRIRDGLIGIAPLHERTDLLRLYGEIRGVWTGYLRGQIRLVVILAIIYVLAWQSIGLSGALPLGLLAGLLNLLPEIGPAAVAVLATVVGFLEGSSFIHIPNLWFAALTLGVFFLLSAFKTVWLQPRILGHSVLLHEGVVFIAIVTALVLQGVLGVLIVVPLLATVVVVGKYVRRRLLGLSSFEDSEDSGASADLQPAAASTIQPVSSRTSG